MPMSDYFRGVREKVGNHLLVMPSVTGLVFDAAGRVLLARHSNGNVWVAPGGAVEPDESPTDAIVREFWEETGLLVAPVALRGVFGGPEFRVRYENGDETSYVMAVFECQVLAGTPRADGVETLETRYVGVEDLPGLALARWAKAVLPALMATRDPIIVPPAWRPAVGNPKIRE